tara:strand:- start:431 stop:1177 length:747 start_codon:yes stop_codon:yes gene_type:complete
MNDLLKYTLRIADNSLILAQRMSEWCSYGPTLEEDIALSNIALDLFGQANGFLQYAAQIDKKRSADDFAFKRNADEFFNHQLVEQENGDFGRTIIRNLINDTFYFLFYQELTKSNDEMLAGLAQKSLKEIKYHLRHSQNWTLRLGDGTIESNKKVQDALNNLWQFTGELFEMDDVDKNMLQQKIGVNNIQLRKKWDDHINKIIKKANLTRPEENNMQTGNREGKHTKYLSELLTEMQHIPRKYPDAKW